MEPVKKEKRVRYYRDIGESLIPLYCLPGKFHQIKNTRTDKWRPWYVAWYPHTPCHFCDRIEIFYYSPKRIPKLWRCSYVELGKDADNYNLPLGLKFLKGRPMTLPIFARKILLYILRYFDETNICKSKREMNKLVKDEVMFPYFNSPVEIMENFPERDFKIIRFADMDVIWETSN